MLAKILFCAASKNQNKLPFLTSPIFTFCLQKSLSICLVWANLMHQFKIRPGSGRVECLSWSYPQTLDWAEKAFQWWLWRIRPQFQWLGIFCNLYTWGQCYI